MINSKQRAYLRGLANNLETILIIGKGEITDNIIMQADTALTARYAENCRDIHFDDIDAYYQKLIQIYEGKRDLNTLRNQYGV